MRRKDNFNNLFNMLILIISSILAFTVSLNTATASAYTNVSIVNIKPIDDALFSHQLRLRLDNREETLLLNKSEAFTNTTILTIDKAGSQKDDLHGLEIYQGQLENVSDSWVRLVIEGNDVAGIIDTGDERIHLHQRVLVDGIRQIQSAINPPFGQLLATPIDPLDEEKPNNDANSVVEIDIGSGFFNQPEEVTKVASIAIVIDSAYDEAIGGRGLAQAISTINAVDGIYREEFGLALKVEIAIMVTDNETLALSDISLEDNLARFRDYRLFAENIQNDLALVHLFTGVITVDPSVGLAYIDTVCSTNGYDVSLSAPFRYPILLTAHEIGHNLGALHDDETSQCSDLSDKLMFSHINEFSTRAFSSCSVESISKRMAQSTCHADAIDMDITLARQDDTGIIALVTNTDSKRAFPAATLEIDLTHATIAAAPASCEVISDNALTCAIATTLAEESQSLAFELRLENEQEITISANLDPIGFLDVHNANNRAEIVIPQVILTTQNDLDNADENPNTADATDGAANIDNNISHSSGGGVLGALEWLISMLIFTYSFQTTRRYI